jgi:uncharacterized protein YecT (DUF1311 family)
MTLLFLVALAAVATHPGNYSDFQVSVKEADRVPSAAYRACMSRSLHNDQYVECIKREWAHLDGVLSAEYRKALARMPPGRSRERLREAERHWLADKDGQCDEEVKDAGPTPYDMVWYQCRFDEVVRRIAWLRGLTR